MSTIIDVLLTVNKGFEFRQNLSRRKFGIAIFYVERNRMDYYRLLIADMIEAIERSRPGTVIHVGRWHTAM